ncbi:MAG: M3 family oligoendopeptidase [Bacteroidia bacterium]|nr:M3 family oligoendopeptidase [Bacteroidia bacterium]
MQPYFDELLQEEVVDADQMESWLLKYSELDSAVEEDYAWLKILSCCDTHDAEVTSRFQDFLRNSLPHLLPLFQELKKKFFHSPALSALDQEKYLTMIREIRKSIEIYRDENIPLNTEIRSLGQKYSALIGGLSVEFGGENYSLPRAASLLEETDRTVREEVFRKISAARTSKRAELDDIFDQLLKLRHQVARNAGFSSFTAFTFKELGRFDYSQDDCDQFRNSIEKVVKPVYASILKTRKDKLKLEVLEPWDLTVNIYGSEPLRPFASAAEMWDKTVILFETLRPELGDMLREMRHLGFVDLESRVGKAPGAFSYRMAETGVPFIFMNAVGTQADLTTIVHEAGHSIHAFLSHHLPIIDLKNVPSEVAELAAMAMELIALDHYHIFYDNEADLKRAKREQITRTLTLLPWIGAVDAFQKWVYDHPDHTHAEREQEWMSIYHRYHGHSVSWENCPGELETMWHKQVHIFEMPFYYIEYGMAQLGAIAIWRNCKMDPEKGLQQYLDALSLGYTTTIPRIYEAAGIKFDFSEEYIRELCDFVQSELSALD